MSEIILFEIFNSINFLLFSIKILLFFWNLLSEIQGFEIFSF